MNKKLMLYAFLIILGANTMAQETTGNIRELPISLTYLYLSPHPDINNFELNQLDYICLDYHSKWYLYHFPSDVLKTLSIPDKMWQYPFTKTEYKNMIKNIIGKKRLNEILNNN